jgi:quinol monooxygenase YgiN
MTAVIVVATVVPIPEQRQEVIDAFVDIIAKVHAEDGCELYALHEGSDRLVMIEKWASAEALDAHARGPLLAELQTRLAGRLIGALDVQVLTAHPAGTDAQGVL